MRPLQTYPLMNFKETSSKDIFLRHLKGLPIDFGFITLEDKSSFIDFAILHNMLVFICHKEYRGILGEYIVLEDFVFNIDREDNRGKHFLRLRKDDTVEISELYPISHRNSCHASVRPDNSVKYEIYTYVTNEERAAIYEL